MNSATITEADLVGLVVRVVVDCALFFERHFFAGILVPVSRLFVSQRAAIISSRKVPHAARGVATYVPYQFNHLSSVTKLVVFRCYLSLISLFY